MVFGFVYGQTENWYQNTLLISAENVVHYGNSVWKKSTKNKSRIKSNKILM